MKKDNETFRMLSKTGFRYIKTGLHYYYEILEGEFSSPISF